VDDAVDENRLGALVHVDRDVALRPILADLLPEGQVEYQAPLPRDPA
jgi:hypothetical protein